MNVKFRKTQIPDSNVHSFKETMGHLDTVRGPWSADDVLGGAVTFTSQTEM